MSTWRCPHCRAPQPETARCWVCQRSTTCCATCRHFRRGVAPGLGYCGLDRQRRALHGDEMRACWSGAIAPLLDATRAVEILAAPVERRTLGFVPVETLVTSSGRPERGPDHADEARTAVEPDHPMTLGWTLWGDAFL